MMWIFWVVGILVGYAIMAGITVYVMETVGYRVGNSEPRSNDHGFTILTSVLWWFCLFVIVPTTMAYKLMLKQQANREERRRVRQLLYEETVGKE